MYCSPTLVNDALPHPIQTHSLTLHTLSLAHLMHSVSLPHPYTHTLSPSSYTLSPILRTLSLLHPIHTLFSPSSYTLSLSPSSYTHTLTPSSYTPSLSLPHPNTLAPPLHPIQRVGKEGIAKDAVCWGWYVRQD